MILFNKTERFFFQIKTIYSNRIDTGFGVFSLLSLFLLFKGHFYAHFQFAILFMFNDKPNEAN